MLKSLHRIISAAVSLALLFNLVACTTAADADNETKPTETVKYVSNFNKTEPQYYMNLSSAASDKGFYYISGEALGTSGLSYLFFYDKAQDEQYPLCSKTTCQHNNEDCDAHTILKNIISNAIWYYKDRLYMIERTDEYDHIISYDLYGRDRQNHTVLNVDSFSVWDMATDVDDICFNDGYVYYFTANAFQPSLYRASIADGSKPELITTYDNSAGRTPLFMLTAMPGKVYVNFRFTDVTTGVKDYLIDYYDLNLNKFQEVLRTDSNKDSDILGWTNGYVLFDNNGYMYYATATASEYVVNRLDTVSKKIEKFYAIECDNSIASGGFGGSADSGFITLENFDGTYLYISKAVNSYRKVADFKETTIKYGTDNNLNMTTKVNTNYIFMVNRNGNCTNIIPMEVSGLKESYSKQQGMLLPNYIIGDSTNLVIAYHGLQGTRIKGYELTDEDSLKIIEEALKDPINSKLNINTWIMFSKSTLIDGKTSGRNMLNKYSKANLSRK